MEHITRKKAPTSNLKTILFKAKTVNAWKQTDKTTTVKQTILKANNTHVIWR